MQNPTVMVPEGYVPIAGLQADTGVAASTLRRRLRLAKVAVFIHPLDTRARMIRREDAEELFRPKPATNRSDHALLEDDADLARQVA